MRRPVGSIILILISAAWLSGSSIVTSVITEMIFARLSVERSDQLRQSLGGFLVHLTPTHTLEIEWLEVLIGYVGTVLLLTPVILISHRMFRPSRLKSSNG